MNLREPTQPTGAPLLEKARSLCDALAPDLALLPESVFQARRELVELIETIDAARSRLRQFSTGEDR